MTKDTGGAERMWAENDRKRAAIRQQRRRLEWALAGSSRDLQKFAAAPIELALLTEALELALSLARELADVMKAEKLLDDGEFA